MNSKSITRVIFDTNIYLSYLIAQQPGSTVVRVLEAAVEAESIAILLPPELIREILDRAVNKPYFRKRISPETLVQVLNRLITHSKALPELEHAYDRIVRDHGDDYLVAYGLVHDVDYLVTGDNDLLSLVKINELKIVRPARFLNVLQQNRLQS